MKLEFVRDRKSEIQELAASHGARNVRLFGSVARGDSREAIGMFRSLTGGEPDVGALVRRRGLDQGGN